MTDDLPVSIQKLFGKQAVRLRLVTHGKTAKLSVPVFAAAITGANPESPDKDFQEALKKAARDIGTDDIELVQSTGESEIEFETSLKKELGSDGGPEVEDVFLRLGQDGSLEVRVEVESISLQEVDDFSKGHVSSHAERIANDIAGATIDRVEVARIELNTPPTNVIFRTIRYHQPLSESELRTLLEGKGYEFPRKVRWMERRLDKFRKSSLLLWDDGNYVVTEKGIRLMHGGEGRDSADVCRALALGERYKDNS